MSIVRLIYLFAVLGVSAPLVGAPKAPSLTQLQNRLLLPPPEAMIIMIRATMVALSQANATNNYTVLHDLASPNFQAANSSDKLRVTFAPFRKNALDLAPVVYVTPQITAAPSFEGGRLRLVGNFPTQPLQIDYDMEFEPVAGVWKLYTINVGITRVAPRPSVATVVPFPPR